MKAKMTLGALLFSGVLVTAPLSAQAQPPEGKGQGQQKEHKYRDGELREQKREYRRDSDRDEEYRRDRERERREDRRYPNIDETALRLTFREHRDWLNDGQHRNALPPGIRKNLQRGKPLPPGIAKRFDPRLRERLPYYEGYEWQRVGDKAVLVDLATDNVRFILESIFD